MLKLCHVRVLVLLLAVIIHHASCTIEGLTYMSPIRQRNLSEYANGEDPCHPLYWYPRAIPEYCQYKTTPKDPCVTELPPPIPVPLPVPMPQPVPVPLPVPPPPIPVPMPPPPMPVPMPPAPMPYPIFPPLPPQPPMPLPVPVPPSYLGVPPAPQFPPLPYGVPLSPTNPMLPVGGLPFPYLPPYHPEYNPHANRQVGMVPGVPGIVSPNGGINVLPFSDAYSDMLQSRRQRMINREMQKIVDKYDRDDRFRYRGYRRSRRRYRRY